MGSKAFVLCSLVFAACAAIATHKKEAADGFEWEKDWGKRGVIGGGCFGGGSDVVSDAFGDLTEVKRRSLADSGADRRRLPADLRLRSGPGGRGGSLRQCPPPIYKTGNDASIPQNKGVLW
jgi:hypothetical protein